MLYEPLTFRSGAVMPNRIALAPMTNGRSLPDGRPGDDELAWLARCAMVPLFHGGVRATRLPMTRAELGERSISPVSSTT